MTSKDKVPPNEIVAELRWTHNRPELAQIYLRHLAQRAADEIERLARVFIDGIAAVAEAQRRAPATDDHLDKIKNERLNWGMICSCKCQACRDLDAVIRGVPPEKAGACDHENEWDDRSLLYRCKKCGACVRGIEP